MIKIGLTDIKRLMDIKESKIYQISPYKKRHPWETARLSVIDLLFKTIVRGIPAGNPTVLDFGCGDAFVLGDLSKTWPDMNFLGVDSAYTPEQIQLNHQQPHLQKCRFFQDLNSVSPGQADIALLLDVLEHADNDADVLSSVVSRLKPGGYVLSTVPAFQSLFCGHDRWLGHYRRYTQNQLCRLSTKSGLEICRSGYFFSGLVLPRLCYKLFECVKLADPGKCVGIGEWSGGDFLGNIIKTLLVINAKADICLSMRHLSLFGLSVFAICKKSL